MLVLSERSHAVVRHIPATAKENASSSLGYSGCGSMNGVKLGLRAWGE